MALVYRPQYVGIQVASIIVGLVALGPIAACLGPIASEVPGFGFGAYALAILCLLIELCALACSVILVLHMVSIKTDLSRWEGVFCWTGIMAIFGILVAGNPFFTFGLMAVANLAVSIFGIIAPFTRFLP